MIRFLFGVVYLALVVWAVIDIIKSNKTDEQKFTWIAVIVFVPLIGPVVYYLISRGVIKV